MIGFDNILGLWALSIVAIFLIFYLIKPKPKKLIFPSLIFFLQELKKSKKYAFLRKLLHNLLFLLQLLLLLALALSVAAPFVTIPLKVDSLDTVIIIDNSASMQTKEAGSTRLELAKKEAKDHISIRTSVIEALSAPSVKLENGFSWDADKAIGNIRPASTPTNLGDALMLAKDILGDRKGKVVLISDFQSNIGTDISVAKKLLELDDIFVELIPVGTRQGNIAFIQAEINNRDAKLYVRNYFNEDKEITIILENNGNKISESSKIELKPSYSESITLNNLPVGINKIYFAEEDSLELDNSIYISIPQKSMIKALLITDLKQSSLISALDSSPSIDFDQEIFLPDITKMKEYDVIVMDSFQYIRGTIVDMKRFIQDGGHMIITAQDDLGDVDIREIMPVSFQEKAGSGQACIDIFNEYTRQFENEPCFTQLSSYLKTSPINGSIVVASVDGNPVIAFKDNVYYYGIYDGQSDFKTSPSYPIFWNNLLNSLVELDEPERFNLKTGDILFLDSGSIKTPSGSKTGKSIMLDEQGIYDEQGKSYAANLLDKMESDLNHDMDEIVVDEIDSKEQKISHRFNLEMALIIFALIMLLIELIYIKVRGDI